MAQDEKNEKIEPVEEERRKRIRKFQQSIINFEAGRFKSYDDIIQKYKDKEKD